ncbi:STAS domain-containing protein [Actinoplanes sp. DH11]|uniref:STAS domain-containing protein n=1 Tax=Actinoplanes sp. DH11 TaxID=2857011 RepID=UPI001E494338|nr:STAS domain-containing protein [Actinoplanes sp. DH11]
MSDFETHTIHQDGTIVVALAGECDLRSRDEMMATLLAAVGSGDPVTVDLAGVRFLDSSGLHALVTAHHAARERAGSLYVVNATGTVATVLRITGVLDLLRHPTLPAQAGDSQQADQDD